MSKSELAKELQNSRMYSRLVLGIGVSAACYCLGAWVFKWKSGIEGFVLLSWFLVAIKFQELDRKLEAIERHLVHKE